MISLVAAVSLVECRDVVDQHLLMSPHTGYLTTVLPPHRMALIPRVTLQRASQMMTEIVAMLRALQCDGRGISTNTVQMNEIIGSSVLILDEI
jgi:hypothetical protein